MALIKTSNPALGSNTFRDVAGAGYGGAIDVTTRMTMSGTINKTAILLLCAVATAAWTWSLFLNSGMAAVSLLMTLGFIGGFIFAMITVFKKQWAPVCAPIYALLEGLALGGISAMYNQAYHGIALEAVGLTFTTLFVMLFLYKSRIIKVTQRFMIGVAAATGGIFLFYMVEWVLSMFHFNPFGILNGNGAIGIGFSLFIVGIAALNLVLDFAFIEQGVNYGAPKFMEWYGAFGIMVTLVWLYLEMLRLLSKINSRN